MTVVERVGLVIVVIELVVVLDLDVLELGPAEGANSAGGGGGLTNVRVDAEAPAPLEPLPAPLPVPAPAPAPTPVLEDPLTGDLEALELMPSGVPGGGNSVELDDGNRVLDVEGELSVDGELGVNDEPSVEPVLGLVGERPEDVAPGVPDVATQSTPGIIRVAGIVCANDALGATKSANAHPSLRP